MQSVMLNAFQHPSGGWVPSGEEQRPTAPWTLKHVQGDEQGQRFAGTGRSIACTSVPMA